MFEAKVENKIKEMIENPEEELLVKTIRENQICQVIDSLEEEEFNGLQRSIEQSFQEVSNLFRIVKEGIQRKQPYQEILEAVNMVYENSPENSIYYRKQYMKLMFFLRSMNSYLECSDTKEGYIEEEFKITLEEPLRETKEEVLKAIVNRNDLKNRVRNSELDEETRALNLYHLYQEIWQVLGFDVLGKTMDFSACDEIKKLILSMIHLKDSKLAVFREEEISKCIENMNQRTAEVQQDYLKFRDKISDLKMTNRTVKESDKDLEELINLIEKIPTNSIDYYGGGNPRKELQMIKNSNWFIRRAIYSNWEIISHGDENFQRDIDFSRLLSYVKMQVGYSEYVDQIRMETIDQINSIFQLELWNGITNHEILDTDLYCKNFGKTVIFETSSEAISKKLTHEKEMGSLRGIVYNFYLSFVESEEEKKKIHTRLDGGKLDKIILGIVEKIEAVKNGFSQNLQEALEKIDSRYITISSELENLRAVQEEDVINAIIEQTPLVYQKAM